MIMKERQLKHAGIYTVLYMHAQVGKLRYVDPESYIYMYFCLQNSLVQICSVPLGVNMATRKMSQDARHAVANVSSNFNNIACDNMA